MALTKFFSVIIPTYNNADTIERAINSVLGQSFKDFELIVVDDASTDGTTQIVGRGSGYRRTLLTEKRYSGGARNYAVQNMAGGDYILFLDGDDYFVDNNVLTDLYKCILQTGYPDMVRLPYIRVANGIESLRPLWELEHNIDEVAVSTKVACWTKCVKRELLAPFPENTLMEDVCQHLAQCDVCNTVAWLERPCVKWVIRPTSTSNSGSFKWRSSMYRYIADLMDLELKRPSCVLRRQAKLTMALEDAKNGKAIQ